MRSSAKVCAGAHGFNGGKSGTVVLGPGVHDIRIDYSQVPPRPAHHMCGLPLVTNIRNLAGQAPCFPSCLRLVAASLEDSL